MVEKLWKSKTKTEPSACKDCYHRAKSDQPKTYVKVASSKPIKPISDKQTERLKAYRKVRDQFLKDNPFCMVCGAIATDLHHAAGKTGDLLTNVQYFRSLCRKHHSYYEVHVSEAKQLGISVDRLDK